MFDSIRSEEVLDISIPVPVLECKLIFENFFPPFLIRIEVSFESILILSSIYSPSALEFTYIPFLLVLFISRL